MGYLSAARPPAAADASAPGQRLPGPTAPLRDLGYVEGQNIAIERRYAEDHLDRLPGLAAEVVGLDPDVILADGNLAALAARDASSVIPIVAVLPLVADPVRSGLVASLAHPGGNLTGLIGSAPELWGKRLELLTEAVPGASRVAVLWNIKNMSPFAWEGFARALRVQLQVFDVASPDELAGAFDAAVAWRAEALIAPGSAYITPYGAGVAALSLQNRLPAISDSLALTRAGILLAYAANPLDLYRGAATLVDKILRGAKPADLPVEQPTKFDFVINLKTAQALGLTIPQSVLMQATEVIQ